MSETRDPTRTAFVSYSGCLFFVMGKDPAKDAKKDDYMVKSLYCISDGTYHRMTAKAIGRYRPLTGALADQAWLLYDDRIKFLAKQKKQVEMLINTYNSLLAKEASNER